MATATQANGKTKAKVTHGDGTAADTKQGKESSYDALVRQANGADMRLAQFILCGKTPLLMNKRDYIKPPTLGLTPMNLKRLAAHERDVANKNKNELDKKTYRLDGVLHVQEIAVEMAAIHAVGRTKDPYDQWDSLATTLRRVFRFDGQWFPLMRNRDGELIDDFEIDTQGGNNPNRKNVGVNIARPRIELPWYAPISLRVNMAPLQGSKEALIVALTLAGDQIGIGDWRNEKTGPMGKFTIANFDLVDVPEARLEHAV